MVGLRAFGNWRAKSGYTLVPGRLIWWRSSDGRWGWTRDAYGAVFHVGHFRYYPKENRR